MTICGTTLRVCRGRDSMLDWKVALPALLAVSISSAHGATVVSNGTTLVLEDTDPVTDDVSLQGFNAPTNLQLNGDRTLDGSFQILGFDNPFEGITTNGGTLTNGLGSTISGGGRLIDDTGNLLNQGTIRADVGGVDLVIDAVTGGQITNQGQIAATGGNIRLNSTIVENEAGGVIEVAAGSTVSQFQSTVFGGGTINVAGGGTYAIDSAALVQNTVNNDGTLALGAGTSSFLGNGLTLNGSGSVEVSDGHTLNLIDGTSSNNSTINLNSGAAVTSAIALGDHTISGTGELVLLGPSARVITDGGTLTNGVGHTIRGGGDLLGNTGSLVNAGTLRADSNAQDLVVQSSVGGQVTNVGTIAAEGGDLQLIGSSVDNAGGSINVAGGSTFTQSASTVSGAGTINIAAGSSYNLVSGGALLNNTVNVDGDLTIDTLTTASIGAGLTLNGPGQVTVSGGLTAQDLNLVGGQLTNNAAVSVLAGAGALVVSDQDHLLSGSGSVDLDSAVIRVINGRTLTNGADHTLRGRVTVRSDLIEGDRFVNNGDVISAEIGGQVGSVLLSTTGGTVNNGRLLVDAGSSLTVDGSRVAFENTGLLDSNGSLFLQGSALNSGEMRISGSGNSLVEGLTQSAGSTQIDSSVLLFGADLQILGGTLGGTGSVTNFVVAAASDEAPANASDGGFTSSSSEVPASPLVLIDQGGALLMGGSEGGLTFDADLVIGSQGLLTVSLLGAGAEVAALDLLRTATIDGILDLRLDAAFAETLQVGELIELISGTSFSGGGFSAIDVTALGFDAAGFGFETEVIGSSLFLRVSDVGVVPVSPPLALAFAAWIALSSRRFWFSGRIAAF